MTAVCESIGEPVRGAGVVMVAFGVGLSARVIADTKLRLAQMLAPAASMREAAAL